MAVRVIILGLLLATHTVGAAEKKCQLGRYAEVPVTLATGVPLVAGSVNGVEGKFVVDNASFFSFLSKEFADQLKLRLTDDPTNARVYGSSRAINAQATKVKEFSIVGFAGNPFKDVDFLVRNDRFSPGVLGELGQNVFGVADSEYDLAKGFLRLFRSKDCGNASLAYWKPEAAFVTLEPTSAAYPHFVGTVVVNGKKVKAIFMSESSYSLITLKAAKAAGFDPKAEGVTESKTYNSSGSEISTWIARFDSIKFGDEEIKNTRLRVVDTNYGDVGEMLLGLDFYLSHRIYFAKEQRRAYVTHNGGPVFSLSLNREGRDAVPEMRAGNQPATAQEFRLRGAGYLARKEFDAALADFDQAVKLGPDDLENFRQRAMVHSRMQKFDLAIADATRAIELQSSNADLYIERASFRFYNKDREGGLADYRKVLEIRPNDPGVELRIARIHDQDNRVEEAMQAYDQWVKRYPNDPEYASALNSSCWLRVTKTTDFQAALPICNAAVKADKTGQTLDSRGMAWLRLGEYKKAIDDYKAAIKLRPKEAWSLYGLSIAEARTGKTTDAAAHREAALAVNPSIAEEYKKIGVE